MKKLFISVLFVGACSSGEMTVLNNTCSVNHTSDGTVITCPDKTTATVHDGVNGLPGRDGLDGTVGLQGVPGMRGQMGPSGQRGAQGLRGMTGLMGPIGPRGVQGLQGPAGTKGATGSQGESVSMTVENSGSNCLYAGVKLQVGSGPAAFVCNGAPGIKGDIGPAGPVLPLSAMDAITPCSPNSSPWKEIIFCLADGHLLGSFSTAMSGYQTRLTFLSPGSYEDTDLSGCSFNVASDGAGGNIISWGSGSNSYSSWSASSFDCVAEVIP
jgi:hypothetical protein